MFNLVSLELRFSCSVLGFNLSPDLLPFLFRDEYESCASVEDLIFESVELLEELVFDFWLVLEELDFESLGIFEILDSDLESSSSLDLAFEPPRSLELLDLDGLLSRVDFDNFRSVDSLDEVEYIGSLLLDDFPPGSLSDLDLLSVGLLVALEKLRPGVSVFGGFVVLGTIFILVFGGGAFRSTFALSLADAFNVSNVGVVWTCFSSDLSLESVLVLLVLLVVTTEVFLSLVLDVASFGAVASLPLGLVDLDLTSLT